MLTIFPFLTLVSIFLLISTLNQTKNLLFREKILISVIIWCLILTAITELLSIPHMIDKFWISTSWLVIFCALLLFIAKTLNFSPREARRAKWGQLLAPRSSKSEVGSTFNFKTIPLSGIIFISTATFLLALLVPPNNYDAGSYTLPRVMQWIQNHSISYYPTHVTRQVYLPPFGSFAYLHAITLSGTDYFTGILQWGFMVGSLVGISLIAYYFKANIKTQVLAAFIAASIPMGILHASSSHDNYFLIFFLVAFVYFSLKFVRDGKKIDLVLSSAALGLATLTKQTAYIFASPFILWFFYMWLSKFGIKKSLISLLTIISLLTFINLGFFARNYAFSKSPIFSLRDDYLNSPVGIQSLVSGTIKNISLHTSTPLPQINQKIYDSIALFHRNLNIPLDGRQFNYLGLKFHIPKFAANESETPNGFHLILILASSFILLKGKVEKPIKKYILCAVAGFLIFCAFLKWQVGASRLQLPLFVLWSVPIALALDQAKPVIKNLTVAVLLISSLYFLLFNIAKPVISKNPIYRQNRQMQYFLVVPQRYQLYKNAAQFIKNGGYKNIGFVMEEERTDYEYPLWIMLKQDNPNVLIKHVNVKNPTNKIPQNFTPDVIVYFEDKSFLIKYPK